MTPSEQLVFDLCKKSFLSLWSYASPQRPDARELCDALAVFGDHIIIFSVKEIALKEGGDPEVAADRWRRKAIDDSIRQLAGANRELKAMTKVVRADGTDGVDLPPFNRRKIHRIAVAVGSDRAIPFPAATRDHEYIHIMDDVALSQIMQELDTTPDFVEYLAAKEGFQARAFISGEENLLGLYLHGGRKLPTNLDMLIVEDDYWEGVRKKPEFIARKREDKVSYWWDDTIEGFIRDLDYRVEATPALTRPEIVVRTMAKENRFSRRVVSAACVDWLRSRQRGARTIVAPSGVAYVFATYPRDFERDQRCADLGLRCVVARQVTGHATVVGIATEIYDPAGYSMDAIYLHLPEWTEAEEKTASEAREKLGIMESPILLKGSFEEFPQRQRRAAAQQQQRRPDNKKVRRKLAKAARKKNRHR